VRVDVVEEAQAQFAYRDAWWRTNRDAQELLVEEYERALTHLTTSPKSGDRYRIVRGKLIRRWLMKKTECHIYYCYSEELDVLEIRAFWGAKRRYGPAL
jgi:hypothetical protein